MTASIAWSASVQMYVKEKVMPPPLIWNEEEEEEERDEYDIRGNLIQKAKRVTREEKQAEYDAAVAAAPFEDTLMPRKMFLSQRGMLFIADPAGKVRRSFEAHFISDLQACTKEVEKLSQGPPRYGPRGEIIEIVNKEMITVKVPLSLQISFDSDPSHPQWKPIRCMFPNQQLLTEFSQFVRYFNELEAAVSGSAAHSKYTTPFQTPHQSGLTPPHSNLDGMSLDGSKPPVSSSILNAPPGYSDPPANDDALENAIDDILSPAGSGAWGSGASGGGTPSSRPPLVIPNAAPTGVPKLKLDDHVQGKVKQKNKDSRYKDGSSPNDGPLSVDGGLQTDDQIMLKAKLAAQQQQQLHQVETTDKPKTVINPYPVSLGKVYSAAEKVEMRRAPVSVWEALQTKDAMGTSRWFYDEFHDQAESMRLIEETEDKTTAKEALQRARWATHNLQNLDQDPIFQRQLQTIKERQWVEQYEDANPSTNLQGLMQKTNDVGGSGSGTQYQREPEQPVNQGPQAFSAASILQQQGHITRSAPKKQKPQAVEGKRTAIDLWADLL